MPKKPERPQSKKAKDDAQKVGRSSPPKHTQFAKGVSGNAKGRPKGSKNLSTIIAEAAKDPVTATIGGKPRQISKVQATAMQLATKAAGGDPRAMGQLLDWVDEIERRAAAARPVQFPFSDADLEVLRTVHERMTLCEPPDESR